ncbi:hypothetical protein H9I45_03265 [Polaribacter haliotis]|uniref:Uncharacterized protein n=1 Tax=Polaribacter haliotis TaxID=1888915 RepID=A0A7L8AHS6_9FLAO|nr:hypothetical protein [Polaribacter haliotis]QOD61484.1 hypothetical protein H9I45_03265 [Polaribacter haliotis]
MVEKKNLTTYVNINDNENYQLLYATQSYFSFFCVYGKFKTEMGIDENNNEIKLLKSIDFHIKNYKGFTYEFKDVNPDILEYKDNTLRIGYKFTMHGGIRRDNTVDTFKDITGIKNIFFSSDPDNFSEMDTLGLKELKERFIDIEYYSNIKEDNNFSASFLKVIEELEGRVKDANYMKTFSPLAVGDNCRNSLMMVIDG